MKHYARLSLTAFTLATFSMRAMEQENLSITKKFEQLTIIDPTKNQPKTLAEICLENFGVDDQEDEKNLNKIIYGYDHFERPVRVPSHLAVPIIEKFTHNFIEEVATQVAPELLTNNLEDNTKIAIIKRIAQSTKVDECREVFKQLMHDPKTVSKIKECINQHDLLCQSMKAFFIQTIYAHKLPEHQLIGEQPVKNTTLSPDGNYTAIQCKNIVTISTIEDNHRIATLTGHKNNIRSILWSPDGKYLATCSWDKTTKIWTFKNNEWQYIATLSDHTKTVYALAWSPDSKYLATGSFDKTAKIWAVKNNECKCVATLSDHVAPISSLAWSPDGKYLAIGSYDHTAKILTFDGQCLAILIGNNTGTIAITSVSWSPDGKSLITCAWDGATRKWNLHVLSTITQHPFSYDEILLIQAIADAQKNNAPHTSEQKKQIFDQLLSIDQKLRDALYGALDPLVNKYELSTEEVD